MCVCVCLSTGSESSLRQSDEFTVIRPAGSKLLVLQQRVVIVTLSSSRGYFKQSVGFVVTTFVALQMAFYK